MRRRTCREREPGGLPPALESRGVEHQADPDRAGGTARTPRASSPRSRSASSGSAFRASSISARLPPEAVREYIDFRIQVASEGRVAGLFEDGAVERDRPCLGGNPPAGQPAVRPRPARRLRPRVATGSNASMSRRPRANSGWAGRNRVLTPMLYRKPEGRDMSNIYDALSKSKVESRDERRPPTPGSRGRASPALSRSWIRCATASWRRCASASCSRSVPIARPMLVFTGCGSGGRRHHPGPALRPELARRPSSVRFSWWTGTCSRVRQLSDRRPAANGRRSPGTDRRAGGTERPLPPPSSAPSSPTCTSCPAAARRRRPSSWSGPNGSTG